MGRLRRDLDILTRVGLRKDGPFDRLAFTTRDLRARAVLASLMRETGMEVAADGFGNVVGTLPGMDSEAAPVVMGSRLATVPQGGRLDGTLGIIGGLEVARRLGAEDLGRRPFRLVMFVCEESSRFGMATLGSRVVAGTVDPDTLLGLSDRDGRRLAEIAGPLGVDRASIEAARWAPGSVHAYLELHIEQGRVLEEAGVPLGVVTRIAAPTRLRVVVEGRQDHSGATPMRLRSDALCAAAEIILAVEEEARRLPEVVGTVGSCTVDPGAFNVVPGRATLGIDVRCGDGAVKTAAVGAIAARMDAIATSRGVAITRTVISDDRPVTLDGALVSRLEGACRARGIPYLAMPSGAGHDAMEIATMAPAGMLFVPSEGGISHSPAEWTDPEQIAVGVDVMTDVVRELRG